MLESDSLSSSSNSGTRGPPPDIMKTKQFGMGLFGFWEIHLDRCSRTGAWQHPLSLGSMIFGEKGLITDFKNSQSRAPFNMEHERQCYVWAFCLGGGHLWLSKAYLCLLPSVLRIRFSITIIFIIKVSFKRCWNDGLVGKSSWCASVKTWVRVPSTHVKSQAWVTDLWPHSWLDEREKWRQI